MGSLPQKPPARGMEAFASRDFRRYQLARVAVILGAEAQAVAVAWQVYSITHRAIDLGYTGLALFLPGLIFLLPAGHTADRFDRRHDSPFRRQSAELSSPPAKALWKTSPRESAPARRQRRRPGPADLL